MYVGSCNHDIDEEWYNSDDSTYIVLDKPTGGYVTITTCRACKEDNMAAGVIVESDDIPIDDFFMVDESDAMTAEELDEYFKNNLTKIKS
jgi:hypothetical protein